VSCATLTASGSGSWLRVVPGAGARRCWAGSHMGYDGDAKMRWWQQRQQGRRGGECSARGMAQIINKQGFVMVQLGHSDERGSENGGTQQW